MPYFSASPTPSVIAAASASRPDEGGCGEVGADGVDNRDDGIGGFGRGVEGGLYNAS